MKTFTLPAALWSRVRETALAELEAQEGEPNRGAAFWSEGSARWLRDVLGAVPDGLILVTVTLPDFLFSITSTLWEVAAEDDPDWIEEDWNTVWQAFHEQEDRTCV